MGASIQNEREEQPVTVFEVCDRAITLIGIVAKKSAKNAVEAALTIDELTKLKGWAYPELTTDDIVRVVRCSKCKNYKKYKKKGDPKAAPFYACSLNMTKRDPDFYCKDGMES